MMKWLVLRLVGAGIETGNIPCADGTCSDTNLVSSLINWSYVGIGVVGVLIIVVAGVQYMISEGEPEKAKRAQMTITYTVIGMIIAFAAATIIGFVTGAFTGDGS